MPIIDSDCQVYIEDGKPDKFCQWKKCPNNKYDEKTSGKIDMKKCAKCSFVRYCSKACQKEDWPNHKQHCVVYNLDVAGWIRYHNETFKWAAKEALHAYSIPFSRVNTHFIVIDLIRSDFAGKLVSPEPFLLLQARAVPFTESETLGLPIALGHEVPRSQKIMDEGGLGLAMILFRVHPRTFGGQGATLCKIHRMILDESPNDDYRHFSGWASFLKNTINHKLTTELTRIVAAS